ncbi:MULTISPECIES: hypothetical protein [Microbacterium]|uniref:hypothetical protein n=1 Tax=Microbacterium TaxID=33882 RepID=UPI00278749B2|nr:MULTISPECIES: hypothetical protein [Microbacterium]MDQ1075442.1 hypothetical protein [Microbacterium sp. SORGH_AS_0969]MDQ1115676.1 hypothetical protein [Microbacterium testaceum]
MAPASSRPRDLPAIVPAVVASIAATVFGAGLGELAAAVISPSASPFAVIGGGMIDIAPAWAKDLAISLFGTADKTALLVGIAVLLLAVAGTAGVVERRRPPWGRVILAAIGVIGALVSLARHDAALLSPVPSLIAGAAAAVVAGLLIGRLRPAAVAPETSTGPTRRRVLALSGVAVLAGALAAAGSVALSSGARAVSAVRAALRLPSPTTTTAVPATADLKIDGLSPVITPSSDFYRIDTALVVPQIDPATWSLRVHGLVEQEVVLR